MSSNPVARALLSPGIYIGLLASAILLILAYQVRPSYDIPFGTATDGPLLRGFNAGERAPGKEGFNFRWTEDESVITLQDVGRQDFDVTLAVNGSRPAGQPAPTLKVSIADRVLLDARPTAALQEYRFSVPREALSNGSLALHISTNAFSPAGDPRKLGLMAVHLLVKPSANPDRFIEPPVPPILALLLASALLGLLMSLLGWGPGGSALGALAVGLLGSWLLAADRLWLTTGRWYDRWPLALLAGIAAAALLYPVGGWLLRLCRTPWTSWQRRALLTLVAVAFAVRLAGQLHPQIFIVDLNFHAHRFETVQSGQLLFTILSAEWGGHQTFYLPTPYVFMLPVQWLLHDELLVIKLATVTFGTLGAFAIFAIARRAMADGRAGLLASALYLTVPMSVLPYSWGITSNVFGEFFLLCSLAIAVLAYRNLTPARPPFWALLFTLLMALLSHPGVVQLCAAAFGLIGLIWLVAARKRDGRRQAAWLLAGLALAGGISYMAYYGHFAADMLKTLGEIRAERAAAATGELHLKVGGSVADKSLGLFVRYVNTRPEWLVGGLEGFWREAQAYYRVWPLFGALVGFWATGSRSWNGRRALVSAALAWALTALLFAAVGWVMNLYVRYALFALPIVTLGCGALLSQVWRRGRAGAWLTAMMLLFFAAEALALWQYRITYAFK